MDLDLDQMASDTLSEEARTKFMRFSGVFLPEEYSKIANAVENFEVYDDDTWVCSFQKSGTTWTQEMVWSITHDPQDKTSEVYINERFPFLEFSGTIVAARMAYRNPEFKMPDWAMNSVEYCKNLPRPRFMKSHLPFNLLPKQIRTGEKKPKIIYAARNPKDVCISFYHHSKLLEAYCGTFEQFCTLFLADRVNYAPYWNHVLSFWERTYMKNLMFLRFEDMKIDLPLVVRRTANFLEINLNNQQLSLIMNHLSFSRMKENPSLNKKTTIEWINSMKKDDGSMVKGEFIRNGNFGQWKEVMSEEMIQRFDKWITNNMKNHTNLHL